MIPTVKFARKDPQNFFPTIRKRVNEYFEKNKTNKIKYLINPPGWSHDGENRTSKELQRQLIKQIIYFVGKQVEKPNPTEKT